MTQFQKQQIQRMRGEGISYSKIAESMSISENTIKSYCKRKNLAALTIKASDFNANAFCKNCGKNLEIMPGRKPRKFCSDSCRLKWWNHHTDLVANRTVNHMVCPCCGKDFNSYGTSKRKYCSHGCYIQDRFFSGQEVRV
jgi:hypothetical protein